MSRQGPGRLAAAAAAAVLLGSCGGHVQYAGRPDNCGHIEAEGFVLEADGTAMVVGWQGTTGGAIRTRRGETIKGIAVKFLAFDSTLFTVGENCRENSLTLTVEDPLMAIVTREPGVEWTFDVTGAQVGTTRLGLTAWHDSHVHVAWGGITIIVEE